MLYSGWDGNGEFFYSMEILYGGIPGRPIGDGMDGHSWWPLFENIPTEYLEAYYPLRIDGYTTVTDSGGAGLPPRRQRRREALRLPRAGRGLDPRRPLADAARGACSAASRAGARRRSSSAPTGPRSGCRRSATTSRSSRATCSSTARRAAAAGRTGSTGRSRRSCATSPSGSSRARRRSTGYGVVLDERRQGGRRRDRGRAGAPARGARRRARASTSARRSRTCSRTARPRPASSRRVPAMPLRWSPLEPGDEALGRVREGDGIPAPS